MEAHVHGFDLVLRRPRSAWGSQILSLLYFDENGHIVPAGVLTEDEHFKQLIEQSNDPEHDPRGTSEEPFQNLTAAFSTGSMDVRVFAKEEFVE
jgi:hypothetical protein